MIIFESLFLIKVARVNKTAYFYLDCIIFFHIVIIWVISDLIGFTFSEKVWDKMILS